MEKSFPFDSELVNGQPDRAYTSEIFRDYFRAFIGNGVFLNPSEQLQVFAKHPEVMQIEIKKGMAFINGAFYFNDDLLTLPIEESDPVLNRIDAVVIQCDYVERIVSCKVIKGVPATRPQHYVPKRNTDAFELVLAEVYVPFASITIKQENITDLRLNSSVCGIVAGTVKEIDTETIFNQYNAKWLEVEKWMEENKSTFLSWVESNKSDYNIWYTGFKKKADNQLKEQDTKYQTQLSNQKSTFESFETSFNSWFNEIKTQIFEARYFDFDNPIYKKDMYYEYDDSDPKNIKEYWKNKIDSSIYASRTNVSNSDGSKWTITTTCNSLGVNNVMVWELQSNGLWKGSVS